MQSVRDIGGLLLDIRFALERLRPENQEYAQFPGADMRFESSGLRSAKARRNAREVDDPVVSSNVKLQRFLAGGQSRITAELRDRRLGLRRLAMRMHPESLTLVCLIALWIGPAGLFLSTGMIFALSGLEVCFGPTPAPLTPEWSPPVPEPVGFGATHKPVIVYVGWQTPSAREGLQADVPRLQFR